VNPREIASAIGTLEDKAASQELKIKELQIQLSQAFRERDTAQDQRDAATATVKLWQKTRDILPVIGVMCDQDFCTSAVGIVGIKAIAVSKLVSPASEIALATGWRFDPDGRSYCPRCAKDHPAEAAHANNAGPQA
jgi:hypothetical protein